MNHGNDPLLQKWRRFRERPPEERALILRAAVLLSLTKFGFCVCGFQRWKEIVEQFSRSTGPAHGLPVSLRYEMARRTVRAVRSGELHGPATPNCLERSMVLWWLLRRDGIDAELHIGARKNDSRFEAHAWVELDGQVLNDSAEVHNHYSRFDAPIAVREAESSDACKMESR